MYFLWAAVVGMVYSGYREIVIFRFNFTLYIDVVVTPIADTLVHGVVTEGLVVATAGGTFTKGVHGAYSLERFSF